MNMTSFQMQQEWNEDLVQYRTNDQKYIYHKRKFDIDTYEIGKRGIYQKTKKQYFDKDDIFQSDWQIGQLNQFKIRS